jgi:hypothetical protein
MNRQLQAVGQRLFMLADKASEGLNKVLSIFALKTLHLLKEGVVEGKERTKLWCFLKDWMLQGRAVD